MKTTAPKKWLESCECILARSINDVKAFLEKGEGVQLLSLDFETTSLDVWTCGIVSIQLAWNGNEAIYIPIGHETAKAMNLDAKEVWSILTPYFESKTLLVFNWQFEGHIVPRFTGLKSSQIKYKDMEPTCWLSDMDAFEKNLKFSCMKHMGLEMQEIQEVPGAEVREGRGTVIRFEMTHPEDAYWYGCSDVLGTYRLYNAIEEKVKARQGPGGFIVNLENDLVGVVVKMSDNMVMLDREFLKNGLVDAKNWQEIMKRRISDWLKKDPDELEINSNAQLAEALTAVGVDLPRTKPTKRFPNGQLTTSQKALAEMRRDNKELDEKLGMLDLYRSLGKDQTTYIARMLEVTTEENPYIRVKVNTCGAPTGRMSSGGGSNDDGYAKLNSQAIPSPDDEMELDCMLVKNAGEKERGPLGE